MLYQEFSFLTKTNSLNELKIERDTLNKDLCETLAKKGSLRRKDYNSMMEVILNILNEKEKEAENQFLNFIEAQKETAQSLKNSLLDIKDISTQDTEERITILKEHLASISVLQEKTETNQIHADRMINLGEMASGIAHEINQPLNIISLATDKILFESEI